MDNRETIYKRMCARIGELPNEAMEYLTEGGRFFSALVILPHHDFRKDFVERLKEAFLSAGFAVDRASLNRISGDEFQIIISTISVTAGKGHSLNRVYWPKMEGLTHAQASTMKYLHESLYPCLAGNAIGSRVVDY